MRIPRCVWIILCGISSLTVQLHGAVQQDIKFDIARADTFYYQGLYKEALDLLNPLDEKLKNSAESVDDRAKVKMLIGLNEFALGNNEKARKQFLEFCNLIPNYSLDEKQYPTRVVALFKDAQQFWTARGNKEAADWSAAAGTHAAVTVSECHLGSLAQSLSPHAATPSRAPSARRRWRA